MPGEVRIPFQDIQAEWTEARAVLARFDENLHDVRKTGFGFVTALLAIQGFLDLPELWRAAVLLATIALVVILSLIDRNYYVLQKGAAQRAMALERRNSFELTHALAYTYKGDFVGRFYAAAYIGLVVVAGGIGWYALDVFDHRLAIVGASAGATVFILFIRGGLLGLRPWVYFETDRFVYRQGEEMLVVLTNFTRGPLWLHGNMWEIYPETDPLMTKAEAIDTADLKPVRTFAEPYKVPADSDHRWRCSTENLKPGLYRIPYRGRSLAKSRSWIALRQKADRQKGVALRHRKEHEEEKPLWLTTTREESKEGRCVVRGRGVGRLCFGGRRVQELSAEESWTSAPAFVVLPKEEPPKEACEKALESLRWLKGQLE